MARNQSQNRIVPRDLDVTQLELTGLETHTTGSDRKPLGNPRKPLGNRSETLETAREKTVVRLDGRDV